MKTERKPTSKQLDVECVVSNDVECDTLTANQLIKAVDIESDNISIKSSLITPLCQITLAELTPLTADPEVLRDGTVWFRGDLNEFRMKANGVVVKISTQAI